MAWVSDEDLQAGVTEAREECESEIQSAIEKFYNRTGLTVKLVYIRRHGRGVMINAATGVETRVTLGGDEPPILDEIDD